MEDFFEMIRKPNGKADSNYIRSEAARLRAYLYTLRDEDRQREVERLQTDLTYWQFVFYKRDGKEDSNKGRLLDYALHTLEILKREQGIKDSEEYRRFTDVAEEARFYLGIGHLPDKEKIIEINYILDGSPDDWSLYAAFYDLDLTDLAEPQGEDGETPWELPEEIDTQKVRGYLQKAKEQGLIDSKNKWKSGVKAELTLFCACMDYKCGIYDTRVVLDENDPKKQKRLYVWKPWENAFLNKGTTISKGLGNTFRNLQAAREERLQKKPYQDILEFFEINSIDEVLR